MPLNFQSVPIRRETAVIKKGAGLALSLFFASCAFVFAETIISATDVKKRDPFVALIDSAGKIKSYQDLFPVASGKPLSADVALRAILWDEKTPAALINNKVYKEGATIVPGLTVEKIAPESVTLSDRGNPVTLKLRKSLK